MSIEVELKFRVEDGKLLEERISALGFQATGELQQSDEYFAHPSRDFKKTDEAVRIRTEGDVTRLTYKGPKIDKLTKTRREIEMDLGGESSGAQMHDILTALGFQTAGKVVKTRVEGHVTWMNESVLIAQDLVEPIGRFVEFELVVERDDQVPKARDAILSLAKHLELGESDRRSYLHILEQGG